MPSFSPPSPPMYRWCPRGLVGAWAGGGVWIRHIRQMFAEHPEIPLNHPRFSNADLNVCLVTQHRPWERLVPFNEKPLHCVVWTQRFRAVIPPPVVKVFDDRTIKIALHPRASVLWERDASRLKLLFKRLVGFGDGFIRMSRHQIERTSEMDRRSDDGGVVLSVAFNCPFKAAKGVRLPKIDARAKPIIIIVAWF